ncbi:hypothetical protein [Chitinophaga pinensis]|uniref:Uncharacterized protein n=1 Tax=Chitinophaga pinensis (strain ATCC 43595 / DSM 2588 / LMG 13176 / NBRC 15968 / NCIMB 11800 / UQM 2034) TaxID=485918 RepID=A0A979GZ72_CHIPD|nr:hypothetical protein [Chitinophaga pinensis]ACU63754.1 hypothetical protein Cpin_6350 [Chitinophaga pinensis DSM 2588]
MNQSETIFDKEFESQLMPRRRDLMPKWLTTYMWAVMVFGFIMLCYAVSLATAFDTNDTMAYDPRYATAFRTGTNIGQFIPGILCMLMGVVVWLERRRAIRFNLGIGLLWLAFIIFMVLSAGIRGLFVGIMFPLFVPYWIGLFGIQKRWEKEAVRGKARF